MPKRHRERASAAMERLEDRRLLTTFVVTGTGDNVDANDGVVTLREAVEQANSSVVSGVVDEIHFDIPGDGVKSIASAGLTITDPVNIDGYTQSDASRNTLATGTNAVLRIELTTVQPTAGFALTVSETGGGSTISGLAIGGFFNGILLFGNDNFITGNYIGLDAAGATARPLIGQSADAISIQGSDNNTIGGISPGDRNVIANSGGILVSNSNGNTIRSNYIGTDSTGTVKHKNRFGVIVTSGNNTNSTSNSIIGNVISGNEVGIQLRRSSSTLIQSNRIGVKAASLDAIGNENSGVELRDDASAADIKNNTIAFNGAHGVHIHVDSSLGGDFPSGNTISRNSIFGNTQLGIELGDDGVTANDALDADEGPNALTNAPIITSATPLDVDLLVKFQLNGLPNQKYRVEFFLTPASDGSTPVEGKTSIGSVDATTDGQGFIDNALFTDAAYSLGDKITATATVMNNNDTGDTSEFSAAGIVTAPTGGTILGILWAETDGNGIFNTGGNDEFAEQGATVFIDSKSSGSFDSGEPVAQTNNIGLYAFVNLPQGTYRVTRALPSGFHFSKPQSGVHVIQLTGQQIARADIGIAKNLANISGVLWSESDGDGVREPGESLLSGRTVFIDADGDNKLDAGEKSTTTNAQGRYTFADLEPGAYRITRVLPTGYGISNPIAGFHLINLTGADVTNADIGSTTKKASISGILWNETDGDGKRESGEPLLIGRVVFIDADGDNRLDSGEKSTTTNSQGRYTFANLLAGTYRIARVLTSGERISHPAAGYHFIQLKGVNVTNADFGATSAPQLTGSISGYLFDDKNKNGKYDSGDKYLPGRTVFIDLDGDNQLDSGEKSMKTNASGRYQFTNLAPGTYKIRRIVPGGYKLTTPFSNITINAGQNATNVAIGVAVA
jgi:parallel beta-helix repeat protein